MNTQQFERRVRQKAQELQKYAQLEFPTEAGNTALRFIDGNFRAQGWQDGSSQRWKANKRKGRILVKKGHLRNATYYVVAPGVATIRNTRQYAKIHNEGGTIHMPARKQVLHFTRKGRFTKKKSKRANYAMQVNRGTYNVTMPQRQFAPTETSPSPVLNKAVERNIVRAFKKIFQ